MDENVLGKNIKYLRKLHGEKAEELGSFFHVAKSTVSGYENGYRRPDSET